MSTSNSSMSSSSFVNQANSGWVLKQLGARPSGTVPLALCTYIKDPSDPAFFPMMENEIKPLEKTAVLYQQQMAASKLTSLFLQTLQREKGSSLVPETLKRVFEVKDQLLKFIQKFSNIDPQLNSLKILTFRLMAHFNQLFKDKEFCEIRIGIQTSKNSASERVVNCLKLQIPLLLLEITQIEQMALADGQDFPKSFQKITLIKQRVEGWFRVASDFGVKNKHTQNVMRQLQTDLALLSDFQLAPQTLIPLAISALGTNSLEGCSPASQELGEWLQKRFQLACDLIDEQCTTRLKDIEQKGAQAKKCRKAVKKFYQHFKDKYQPLWLEIHKSYLSTTRQIYTQSPISSDQHLRNCQERLAELKADTKLGQLNQVYGELLKILKNAPSLPKSDAANQLLIDHYLLPSHNAFQRFYQYSIQSLQADVQYLFKAHQLYVQAIPREQREMQAGLYMPLDLIYFNLMESVDLVYKLTDQPAVTHPATFALRIVYQMVVQSRQFYELGFPYFLDEKAALVQLYKQGLEALHQAQEAASSGDLSPLLKKMELLLDSLAGFVLSPSAYPFLFNYLGSGPLQAGSYEHTFSVLLINFIYGQLSELLDQVEIKTLTPNNAPQIAQFLAERGFMLEDLALACQQPVTKGEKAMVVLDGFNEDYLQKNVILSWEYRFLFSMHLTKWEKIPPATVENLPEVCPPFAHLMGYLKNKVQDLSMIEFTEDRASFVFLETVYQLMLLPYQSLSRYVTQVALEHQRLPPHPKKPPSPQHKHHNSSNSSNSEHLPPQPSLIPLPTLQSSAEAIGQSLALCIHNLEAASWLDMRDFHAQIVYHLGSIEDLIAKGPQHLSAAQFYTLLVHQASLLEQCVKLAALARQPQGKSPEALTRLLRSSHRPSEFLLFLPVRSIADPAEWAQVTQIISAVDGFLTAPARYALTTHPWMGLLGDLFEQDELESLIEDNLVAMQALLGDISLSLPPRSCTTTSSPVGCLEGLKDKNLLQSPPQPVYTPYSAEAFSASLDLLVNISQVSRLSPYETTAHLVQRREGMAANLHILRVNFGQLEVLLQEKDPTSWCSSYSSTLLLRAAAILEKSVQTLLFWLPIPAPSDPELHYLLSVRPGPGGSLVPLKHAHGIQENALLCASHLAGNGATTFAQSLESFGKQFNWLDPFIQQLYRYPFSPVENRSANLLRLFNALAGMRRSLHQGDLGVQQFLQKELATTSQNLTAAYDQLIQAHLNAQIIAPVHEIVKASQEVLSICSSVMRGLTSS